jgi:hypothetical protein
VEAGFARGAIDAATRDRLIASLRAGRPLPSTALGGDIFIHGRGSEPRDWTLGCIALDDPAMDFVYAIAAPGTRVMITR